MPARSQVGIGAANGTDQAGNGASTYNAEGKRLNKQDIAGLVEYTYDMDKVILERDGQAQTVAAYTHEGGSLYHDLISMLRSDSYYHLFDGLGSVSEVTDADEAVQNRYRYEAFGQFKLADETVPNPYTYVGAFGVQWDAGTGLHFMQARYYAGTIGRFISVDPYRGLSEDPMSLHRYLYTANDPVNRVDPFGLSSDTDRILRAASCTFICIGIGIAAGFLCEAVCTLILLQPFLCIALCFFLGVGLGKVCMAICMGPDEPEDPCG